MTRPSAPRHLTPESRALFRSVVDRFELEPRHETILLAALEARDRMTQAREAIERDGAYQPDRYGGSKAHPAIAVERDSRTAMLHAWRQLGLDDLPEAPSTPRTNPLNVHGRR